MAAFSIRWYVAGETKPKKPRGWEPRDSTEILVPRQRDNRFAFRGRESKGRLR